VESSRYRVSFSDPISLTACVRYWYTDPVRPVTGRNRSNTNLNSNFLDEAVLTGIPAGYRFGRYTGDLDGPVLSGIPAGYSGLPASFAGIPVVSCSFPTLKKWIPGVK